jgi:WD40 repeat protein
MLPRKSPFCLSVAMLAVTVLTGGPRHDDALLAQEPGPAGATTDRHGDPLPAGALARLGTLRWRHAAAVTFVAFLPDGKEVLTSGLDNTVRVWERDTGKELRRIDLPSNANAKMDPRPVAIPVIGGRRAQSLIALTSDGKTLATLAGNNIQLWNVETGKATRQIKGLQNGIETIAFSHDGSILALRSADAAIVLVEADTGNEVRQIKKKQPQAGAIRVLIANRFIGDAGGLAFSPDGKLLASRESEQDQQKITSFVKLTDVDRGTEVRRIDTPDPVSALAFSPDNKLLAIAAGAAIRLYDPATGKEVRQIDPPGAPPLSSTLSLTFAPDSKTLVSMGRDQLLHVWQTESGEEMHQFSEGTPVAGGNVAALRLGGGASTRPVFSPDSKTLAIPSGNSIRMWDVATGKDQPLSDGHRGAITHVAVARDGKTAVSRGADNIIRSWHLAESCEIGRFQEPPGTTNVAVSPDGRNVAVAAAEGLIRLHEAATGKVVHELKGNRAGAGTLAFAPDGKTLASYGSGDGLIRLFDTTKGSELRQIAVEGENVANPGVVLRGGASPSSVRLAFSPDGQTVIAQVPRNNGPVMVGGGAPPAGGGTMLRMWDVTAGREIRKFSLPAGRGIGSLAVSPDGRILATENSDGTVSLWEIASGKERSQLGKTVAAASAEGPMAINIGGNVAFLRPPSTPSAGSTLTFSPDGATLACRGPANSIRVLDVATAKEIGEFKGHDGVIAAIAFVGDGKRLISGSRDTTMLLWDAGRLKRDLPPELSELEAKEVADLWDDLIGADAGLAFRGMRKLATAPKQFVPFLREHVKPAVPADPKKLARLIADLDSEEFEVRSSATTDLEKLGELAVPALQKALKGPSALETRRRIEHLLGRAIGSTPSAEQIRVVRAVEVLDKIATSEARELLDALAKGAPGALATREAQAVLDRVDSPAH